MRTYGRVWDVNGNPSWVVVTTDANGNNDQVYLTTLAQVLKLNLNESPFYGNYGIPQYKTVVTQVFPDYYAMVTQMQFAPFFASLAIVRQPTSNPPVYQVTAVTKSGAILQPTIAT